VTATTWNKIILRWQFKRGVGKAIKVLVLHSGEDATISEAEVQPCNLMAFAAGKRYPSEMVSRIIHYDKINEKRYHLIFSCKNLYQDQRKINKLSSNLVSLKLIKAHDYSSNIYVGYWIGTYQQLLQYKFLPTEDTYKKQFIEGTILGKCVIVCERMIKDTWNFCDCQKEKWMTKP